MNNHVAAIERELKNLIVTKKEVLISRLKLNGIDRSFEDYANDIIYAVSKSKDLEECTTSSIVDSAFQLAKCGLSIGGNVGHLVPFGKNCTFQIGYEGYAVMLNRAVGIKQQMYEIVYEGDTFDFEPDAIATDENGVLKSIAKIKSFAQGKEKRVVKGAFAYILLCNGNSHALYMEKAEIDSYKPAKVSGSFWGKWDSLMYPKQVFKVLARKLCKFYCHTTQHIMEVISEEENQNIKDINANENQSKPIDPFAAMIGNANQSETEGKVVNDANPRNEQQENLEM